MTTKLAQLQKKLRPFGDIWVSRLGQEFFTLNEDRRYLANIVTGLVAEAEREQEEQKRMHEEHKRKQAENLMKALRLTADGDRCSEDSLNILREALARGYELVFVLLRDQTITVNPPGRELTLYLHSNYDIQKFGDSLEAFANPARKS
jgi:hypothetical protein